MRRHGRRLVASTAITAAVAGGVLATASFAGAAAVNTELVSVGVGGGVGDGYNQTPKITPNGRYVVFASTATNLVAGSDTNNGWDVFRRDTRTGVTRKISVGIGGAVPNGDSVEPSISANGRYVAFSSTASNLVPGDTNGLAGFDVFIADLKTDTIRRISLDMTGSELEEAASGSSISADGRRVAFVSSAPDLVPGDTNGLIDVFVWDKATGKMTRVDVDSSGAQTQARPGGKNSSSGSAAISANGKSVVFQSYATNLVPGDTNEITDIFVHDLKSKQTSRVSVGSGGQQATGGVPQVGIGAQTPSISGNGRMVTFRGFSLANLVGPTPLPSAFYLYDRKTGVAQLAEKTLDGSPSTTTSGDVGVSPDGRYVIFSSLATNDVPEDTNGQQDVFVRDLKTDVTRLVSVSSSGEQGNNWSGSHGFALSKGGRTVVFTSRASNFVANDTNDADDLFIRRLRP